MAICTGFRQFGKKSLLAVVTKKKLLMEFLISIIISFWGTSNTIQKLLNIHYSSTSNVNVDAQWVIASKVFIMYLHYRLFFKRRTAFHFKNPQFPANIVTLWEVKTTNFYYMISITMVVSMV